MRKQVVVPVTPLRPLVDRFTGVYPSHRIVIKVDTEGAEGPILSAALAWLTITKPTLIIAPHERLFPDPLMPSVVRGLKHIYPTAIDPRGDALVWPEGDAPEPSIMLFTTEDVGA